MGGMHLLQRLPLPRTVATLLLAGAVVAGCVSAPPGRGGPSSGSPAAYPAPGSGTPAPPGSASTAQYRCDQNITFNVRFSNDSAVVDAGARGSEVLLRDAGGVTPQQTVYSNPRLRAEFGLGANGREAILRYLAPSLVLNCLRD